MNHFPYNIIGSKIQFKIISLFKKMYFGKTILLCMLYVASGCCLYDSAINYPTPSIVVESNSATQEIFPTSTEMGTTGAMDVGSISDTEMVTKVETTVSIVEIPVIGTNTDKEVDGTATFVTVTATPDEETSTTSSMFFMWREFRFSWCFLGCIFNRQ